MIGGGTWIGVGMRFAEPGYITEFDFLTLNLFTFSAIAIAIGISIGHFLLLSAKCAIFIVFVKLAYIVLCYKYY